MVLSFSPRPPMKIVLQVSQGWIFCCFDSFHCPCMQEWPRGGLLWCFDPFSLPPPPSCRAGDGFLQGFNAICAISTSVTWKPEVDFLALDAVCTPSPTMKWAGMDFLAFWCCSHLPHLPYVQVLAGVDFLVVPHHLQWWVQSWVYSKMHPPVKPFGWWRILCIKCLGFFSRASPWGLAVETLTCTCKKSTTDVLIWTYLICSSILNSGVVYLRVLMAN